MWDEMEPIPRNPFISRALDAWELRLKTESERLKKETEEADIERALRESRARSLNQR
jgi:PIN domain nuclease of toxin-antitoxin system